MHESERGVEERVAELELERAILLRQLASYEASMAARSTRWIYRSQRQARARLNNIGRAAESLRRRTPWRPTVDLSFHDVESVASPIALTTSNTPVVSIVIPVHGKLEVTQKCLASIGTLSSPIPIEVIVIDDASPDDSGAYLSMVDGLTTITNTENQGYLRSVNRAAQQASGEFLFLLNNDTVVDQDCLDVLVETLRQNPDVGAVGAKLLFPDGHLQEAGSFIWRDGSGHNLGHGKHEDSGDYEFMRDVDYCSAAALLVRRSAWDQVGGFDDRYAPAYYEDADLCFAIRSIGLRVVYQPRARVTHMAGASYGSGESSSSAKYQERNRILFATKWADVLSGHKISRTVPYAISRSDELHILVFDEHVPTTDRDSGALRMWGLLHALNGAKRRLTFISTSRHPAEPASSLLRNAGIDIDDGHRSVEKAIAARSGEIDLAIVSRPQVAQDVIPALKKHVPEIPIVYDMVDFHSLRHQRGASLGTEPSRRESRIDAWERSAIEQSDHVLAITHAEAAAVREIRPDVGVSVLGNVHTVMPSTAPFRQRKGLLFVGSWGHPPNRDAAEWLLGDVMPLIWEKATIEVHLVGSGMPEDLGGDDDRVHVHGWLSDLGPIFDRVAISIAPLRFGAGMKGKVGDSLARGVPVVGTTIAAEGFPLQSPGFATAIDAHELADAALRILNDEKLWKRCREEGFAMIEQHLTADRASAVLTELINKTCKT